MEGAAPGQGQAVVVEVIDGGERVIYEGHVERIGAAGLLLSVGPHPHLHGVPGPQAMVVVRWASAKGLHQLGGQLQLARLGERLQLQVAPSGDIAVVQRRRFLRLPLRLGMTCLRLDERGQPREKCVANTLELGGNGAGIVIDRALQVGEKVRFMLPLEEWGVSSGVAQVKRSQQVLGPEGPENRVGLQFMEMDSRSQALVLSYLLSKKRL
jgi:hypothetical protein